MPFPSIQDSALHSFLRQQTNPLTNNRKQAAYIDSPKHDMDRRGRSPSPESIMLCALQISPLFFIVSYKLSPAIIHKSYPLLLKLYIYKQLTIGSSIRRHLDLKINIELF